MNPISLVLLQNQSAAHESVISNQPMQISANPAGARAWTLVLRVQVPDVQEEGIFYKLRKLCTFPPFYKATHHTEADQHK